MLKNFIVVFLLITNINLLLAQEKDSTLTDLINKAVSVSPALEAIRSKQDAEGAEVPQVSNLPDPMLTLGLANLPTNSFSFTQEPMTGKIVGLSQAVPFPGKLNAAGDVQEKDVEIIEQEILDKRNEIINNVSKTYYDLRFTREALRIARQSKDLLNQIAEVVEAKYSVSRATQQNLIQINVEITNQLDRIEELLGRENSNLAVLNSYLLEDPESPIPTKSIPPLNESQLTIASLDSLAKNHRPFLRGIQKQKEKAELMEELAEYEFYPNFNFSVQYSQRDEIARTNTPLNDFFTAMVGISLPINYGGKKSAKVEEAQLRQKMFNDQYFAALQSLQKSFGASLSKLNQIIEREKLIRTGLMPQAQQSLRAALASYEVGEIDFINVIDAQNKLFDIETKLYKLRTEYFKETAQLEFLTGKDF